MMDTRENEVNEFGEVFAIINVPKERAEELCKNKSEATGDRYDWHYSAGRVVIKFLSKDWVNKDALISKYKERIAELEKDAERLGNVCFYVERAIDNGCCPFDIEDAYEAMKMGIL